MHGVRVRTGKENAIDPIVPSDSVMLDTVMLQDLEHLALARHVVDVSTVNHDLIPDVCVNVAASFLVRHP